jgi:hypothetical protein
MTSKIENEPEKDSQPQKGPEPLFKNLLFYVEVYNNNLDQGDTFKEILELNGAKVKLIKYRLENI